MCFFVSLIPATIWFVIGFFLLFASTRTEGGLRRFGKALAIWVFVIAAFFPLCGAYLTLAGLCPIEALMEQMHTLPGQ